MCNIDESDWNWRLQSIAIIDDTKCQWHAVCVCVYT